MLETGARNLATCKQTVVGKCSMDEPSHQGSSSQRLAKVGSLDFRKAVILGAGLGRDVSVRYVWSINRTHSFRRRKSPKGYLYKNFIVLQRL